MEKRAIVDEKLTFGIRKPEKYKRTPFCTWKELIATEGLLPDDQIYEFTWIAKEQRWGFEEDDDPVKYYTPSIIIVRPRPENDDEFEKRMRLKAQFDKDKEEKEKLEYLRLKAKFEK